MTFEELRRCFESALATIILDNPKYFVSSVKKVSQAIIELLTHPKNQDFLSSHNILSDEIVFELYSDTHFGTLGHSVDFCPTQENLLDAIHKTLCGDQSNLPKVIHVQQVVMQYFFDKLPFKSNNQAWKSIKNSLVKLLFQNELFDKRRLRVNEQAGEFTTTIGIAHGLNCPNHLVGSTDLHKNIQGMFQPDPDSYWAKIIKNHELPFVAGPSGHTGSAVLLGKLVAELDQEEMKTYLCATMGTLIGGGYHTVTEVGAIANQTGIPHEYGKYHHLLPQKFLCSTPVKKLAQQYPDLLSPKLCQTTSLGGNVQSVALAAVHGFIRGTAKVMYNVSIQRGLDPSTARILELMFYYGHFFSLQFAEHYARNQAFDAIHALYAAAIDTGNSMLIEFALCQVTELLEKAGDRLINNQWPEVGNSLRKVSQLLPFGLFAYTAYTKKEQIPTILASTAAAAASQQGVELIERYANR